MIRLLAMLCLPPGIALAQAVTPPEAGGPPAGREAAIGRAAGPAAQPPRDDGRQAVNRGTDGSAVGHDEPASTGTTPQGFLGHSTSGAPDPQTPPAGAPPRSTPPG